MLHQISNQANKIKKSDGSFELHDQFLEQLQTRFLLNMFDNFVKDPEVKEKLKNVSDENSAVDFVLSMFAAFKINLFFNPDGVESTAVDDVDDLFQYCSEMVQRFLLSLALDTCEKEGDALGLRAIRRTMVCVFLSHKLKRQDSKYADFTLFDLVVELRESADTRKRMDENVVVNPTGCKGGGLFTDKFQEHCIREIKTCLR